MNVSAVIVTRGDVDLTQIVESLTDAGIPDVIVWDNSVREDAAVCGRYLGIEDAKHDLIYVQDDDVLHTPDGIREMIRAHDPEGNLVVFDGPDSYVTCNMPANFRKQSFYAEHALVGFGAVFHRDLPFKAFERLGISREISPTPEEEWNDLYVIKNGQRLGPIDAQLFRRRCDLVFTALTPHVLVDVLYKDMPWASAPNRMWMRPEHRDEGWHMLEFIKKVRDA
jgi:hypothetical protein